MACILQICYGMMGKVREKKQHIEEKGRMKLAVYHDDLKQQAQVLRSHLEKVHNICNYQYLSCSLGHDNDVHSCDEYLRLPEFDLSCSQVNRSKFLARLNVSFAL